MTSAQARLLSLCSELLCVATAEGRIVDVSPGFERILGWPRDQVLGRRYVELVHPDDHEATAAATAQLASGADLAAFESRWRHQDGSFRRLAWAALAPRSPDDLICARARDITEDGPAPAEAEELRRRLELQEALMAATAAPIIEVWDDILTMPVVGLVDSVRASDMKTALLNAVSRSGARFAILDVTGVETVDTATADHLLKVMRAVQLLGARCVLTGIQPTVARIIVGLGLDLPGIITRRNLRDGLRFCLRELGVQVARADPPAPAVLEDMS